MQRTSDTDKLKGLEQLKKTVDQYYHVYDSRTKYNVLEHILAVFGYGKRAGLEEAKALEEKIENEIHLLTTIKYLNYYQADIHSYQEAEKFLRNYKSSCSIYWFDPKSHALVRTEIYQQEGIDKRPLFTYSHRAFTTEEALTKFALEKARAKGYLAKVGNLYNLLDYVDTLLSEVSVDVKKQRALYQQNEDIQQSSAMLSGLKKRKEIIRSTHTSYVPIITFPSSETYPSNKYYVELFDINKRISKYYII